MKLIQCVDCHSVKIRIYNSKKMFPKNVIIVMVLSSSAAQEQPVESSKYFFHSTIDSLRHRVDITGIDGNISTYGVGSETCDGRFNGSSKL